MRPRDLGPLLQATWQAWRHDRAPSMGAALSYYTAFSIAPLLLIVVGVTGLVLGNDNAQLAIVGQLQALLGEQVATLAAELLQHVNRPGKGALAALIGAGALLVGATSVFAELQDDLDRIWKVAEPEGPQALGGAWRWLRTRLLSFGMVLAIGFLLLVSLVLSAAIAAMGGWYGRFFAGWAVLAQGLNLVVGVALATVLFAAIYRIVPRRVVEWRDVWLGALVTAVLFTIGKVLIGLYIGKSAVASGFGPAGSLAILLVWVYWSAQVFFFGAEFTCAYAHAHGSMRRRSGASTATARRLPEHEAASPCRSGMPGMPGSERGVSPTTGDG